MKVKGKPKPEGKWYKQGVEIVPSQEFLIEEFEDGTSVLTIAETYPDDMGEIVFEVHNSLGVSTTTTYLSVEGNDSLILNVKDDIKKKKKVVDASLICLTKVIFSCALLRSESSSRIPQRSSPNLSHKYLETHTEHLHPIIYTFFLSIILLKFPPVRCDPLSSIY